ncbi:MAG: PmoA family protein [Opitutae bacterium]|nr:PmoA family protein [Opitutae bacterium]
MSTALQFTAAGESAMELRHEGRPLLRYVFSAETPSDEATRPYAHPVCTLAGAELTNFRPNDHRWHHGLSFTINRVAEWNFWGGPTYRKADGYRWRGDHGTQRHVAWRECSATRLVQSLEWLSGAGELLLRERRTLTPAIDSSSVWSLRWQAELENASGRVLPLGNCASQEQLVGSHYTGLQFRGARDLLDEHGDAAIGVFAESGAADEAAVHGVAANGIEWRGQKDGSQRRIAIRFANNAGPLHWFVRRGNPLVAFPFQFDRDLPLAPGDALSIDHTLTFSDL